MEKINKKNGGGCDADHYDVWLMLSCERKAPEGVMTDAFVQKFSRYLNWDMLSVHYDFTVDMLRMYQHRVMWSAVLRRQRFDEEFLREMKSHFAEAWTTVSRYQVLSEDFVHEFAERLDWEHVLTYQTLSQRFLAEHSKYYTEDCWRLISRYQQLSEDFIQQHASKVDWNNVARYQRVSGRFLTQHRDYFAAAAAASNN